MLKSNSICAHQSRHSRWIIEASKLMALEEKPILSVLVSLPTTFPWCEIFMLGTFLYCQYISCLLSTAVSLCNRWLCSRLALFRWRARQNCQEAQQERSTENGHPVECAGSDQSKQQINQVQLLIVWPVGASSIWQEWISLEQKEKGPGLDVPS